MFDQVQYFFEKQLLLLLTLSGHQATLILQGAAPVNTSRCHK